MAMAVLPGGDVGGRWTCEFNVVLRLHTVLIPMEHPHAAGC